MKGFGFKLSASSTIDLDKMDRSKFEQLCSMEPDARRCMACGSCSATCTAAPFSGMSVRKVLLCLQRGREDEAIKLLLCLQRGKEDEAIKMLSACMLCGKCTMVCPRGINTRHLILCISRIYGKKEDK